MHIFPYLLRPSLLISRLIGCGLSSTATLPQKPKMSNLFTGDGTGDRPLTIDMLLRMNVEVRVCERVEMIALYSSYFELADM